MGAPAVHCISAHSQPKHNRHIARQVRHRPPRVLDKAVRRDSRLDVGQSEGWRRCQALASLQSDRDAHTTRSHPHWHTASIRKRFSQMMETGSPEAWHKHAKEPAPNLLPAVLSGALQLCHRPRKLNAGRSGWQAGPNRRGGEFCCLHHTPVKRTSSTTGTSTRAGGAVGGAIGAAMFATRTARLRRLHGRAGRLTSLQPATSACL